MDPQLQQRLMMYGGFIPGAISLILLLAAWYLHAFKESRADHEFEHDDADEAHSKKHKAGPRWMLPLMLAVGFAGADYAANYGIKLWPDSNNYRFTHAIALIALVGMLEGFVKLPLLIAFVFRFFAYGGAFWMLAEGYADTVLGGTQPFVGYALFAALSAATIATAIDRNSEETPAWVDAGSWVLIAGASMPIFLQNHFSIGAMVPAGIIAVLVSTAIVGLIFRSLRLSRGGITVLVGFMLTMLTGSIVQTGVDELSSIMLVAASPMVLVVSMRALSPIKQAIARVILLLIILGASGAMIGWSMGSQESTDEIDPYADYQE